ncbi:hypothetical protein NDU88_003410 [Pleurodeles waltl]|uniref:Uncharacterized protein n=1 Tax=Pleurodeles waltl TaxID=8319 RepID=A0AAV7RIH0_PLEWA|nr:hypothetical protein NDU88_003410 [Pleurodeles waltl]
MTGFPISLNSVSARPPERRSAPDSALDVPGKSASWLQEVYTDPDMVTATIIVRRCDAERGNSPVLDQIHLNVFLSDIEVPTLTDEAKQILGAQMAQGELREAIKDMAHNRSPGSDGLPSECYSL